MSPEDRARRLARNESLVRDVNERISDGAQRFDIEGRTDFLCECANDDCSERVRLTLTDYNDVRNRGDRFVIAPGHDIPELERVVAEGEGFVVVEKLGESRDLATDLDPRH